MVHATVCAKHGIRPATRKDAKTYLAQEWSKGRNDPVNGKIGDELGGGLRSPSFPPFYDQLEGGEKRGSEGPRKLFLGGAASCGSAEQKLDAPPAA